MKNLSLIFDKKILLKKKIFYYGLISEFEKKNLKKKNKKLFFVDEKIISRKERKKRFEECESLFYKILSKLYKPLNSLHKVNFTQKRWEIILSRWLKFYIYIIYLNYNDLKKIIDKQKINKTVLRDASDYNFITNDAQALTFASLEDSWSESLNAKIFEFFFKKNKNYKYIKSKNKFVVSQKNFTAKNTFLKKIIIFFINILKKKNSGVIFSTYLRFLNELKLSLFTSSTIFNGKTHFKYSNVIDFEKRRNLFIDNENDRKTLENFLYKILPLSLPKFVVEDFDKIHKLSESASLPKDPKFILTGIGFVDQVFNFYLSKNIDRGTPIIVLQHGNAYFTHISNNYLAEQKNPDFILSWGPKENSKHIPIFNIKTLEKSKLYDPEGDLLVISDNYYSRPLPENYRFIKEKNMIDTIDIVSLLRDEIQKKTFFKFMKQIMNYRNVYKYYLSIIRKKFNLHGTSSNYYELLKKTRLVLFNYDSSGFYENLTLNIPSVLFCKEAEHMINHKYDECYKVLLEANLLFNDKKKLVNHINKNWKDINKWWYSKKVQQSIKYFNSQLNIPPKNIKSISDKLNLIFD